MFTAPREKQTDRDEGEVCWHTPAPRTYLLSSCYVFNSFIPSINDRTLLQHLATGGDTTLPHAAQPSLFPALSVSLRRSSRSCTQCSSKFLPGFLSFAFQLTFILIFTLPLLSLRTAFQRASRPSLHTPRSRRTPSHTICTPNSLFNPFPIALEPQYIRNYAFESHAVCQCAATR